jgi:prepilin peptidase CpaA
MMVHAQALALIAFAAVMAAAAFEDFRRLMIPNLLPIALCALWPLYFAAAPSLFGALAAIGCALAVFAGSLVLFAFNQFGGGDVKLLTAAALWAGPAGTPSLILLTALIGGALAILLLMPGAPRMVGAARALLTGSPPPVEHGLKMRMPYGLAIIGAALIVVVVPHLG